MAMRTDVLLNMPPSAFMKVPNLRPLSLKDVEEAGEHDEERGDNVTDMVNGSRDKRGVAWAQNGQAHSFDVAPDSSNPKTPAAQLKKRSQSAKRLSGVGVNGSDPTISRSNTTLPPCTPPKSAGHKGGKRRKAFASSKESREDGGGSVGSPRESSQSPQRRTSRADSATFVSVDRLPQSGMSGSTRNINAVVGKQSRRSRFPSRTDEAYHLNDSLGDLTSPRLGSDRLQQSFNGTVSSDTSSDDFPRFRQQSPTGGTGIKDTQQGGLSGADGAWDGNPRSCSPPSGPRAWDMFEEHVRTIHDSSDMFGRHQGPSFHASSAFQETMKGLFGYTDYSKPPTHAVFNAAQQQKSISGAASRFLNLRKRSSILGAAVPPKPKPPPDRKTVENAKRGWRVLKDYVHDNYLSKRTSGAALAWSMLRQTLKGMSDREKSRLDLYRRYGIVPSPDDKGNMVMINSMLSERARKAIANGARHPLLVHTLSVPAPLPPPPSSAPPTRSLSSSLPPQLTSSSHNVGDSRRFRGGHVNVRPLGGSHHDVRPSTSAGVQNGGGGFMSPRNKSSVGQRKSAEWAASKQRTISRSHSP